MREAYSVLAKYYDILMSDFNYGEIASFVLREIKGNNGLELGCGSGELTIALAKRGLKMTAVDKSLEMLNAASGKALKNALDIRFLSGDISELRLEKRFDFILAICDVMNYLKLKDAVKVIDNAYEMLNDGGVFIFDISTRCKLTRTLGNNLFFEEYEDFSYFWQNELEANGKYVDLELVFFEKDENGKYDRLEETQRQYVHEKEDILNALSKFGKTELYGENFEKPEPTSSRLFFKSTK